MEKPNKNPTDEQPDAKAVYEARLNGRIESDNLSEEALPLWLDGLFRYEAVPDNNIVWARAVQSLAGYLTTVQLAQGFAHTQWRATTWENMRVMIEIQTSLIDDEVSSAALDHHKKLQEYYAHKELFEEADLRAQLLHSFSQSALMLSYRYFFHSEDIGRSIDDYELDDALLFNGDELYVQCSALTYGLRAYEADVPLGEYTSAGLFEDFITDCQANTLFNEHLWDSIEEAAPNPIPTPYLPYR